MPMQDRHLRWLSTFSLALKWPPTFEILELPLNRNVVLTLCFRLYAAKLKWNVFGFLSTDKTKLIKNVGQVFCQIFNQDIFG